MFVTTLQLLISPVDGWERVKACDPSPTRTLLGHTIPFALIPPIAGYYGTTQVGWRIGAGEVVRLTGASAFPIAVTIFLAMVAVAAVMAWTIRWMSRTYGEPQSFARAFALASLTATPLFLVGLVQVHPILWLDLLLGLPALGYTVYLFFTGTAVMMEVTTERAFLFASAVMACGLVALVALLAATALLWASGLEPVFVSSQPLNLS